MNRIKQLDSLRAIAVLLVIFHHAPIGADIEFFNAFPLGANLFLVLTGYLITSILLHEKEKGVLYGSSTFTLYKNFLAKRALRIFPLYFLVVLLMASLYGSGKPYLFLSLATFTSNFYQYYKQAWNEYAHTWSLSVQEQFYFIWPIVLLLAGKRSMLPAILSFIVIGVLSSLFIFTADFGFILTPTCFDALGVGALLAWLLAQPHLNRATIYRWVSMAAAASLFVFLGNLLLGLPLLLPFRTLYAVMVAWLICYIVYKGEKGVLNKRMLLNNPVLHFIGKISFGLYMLHPILPLLLARPLAAANGWLPAALQAQAPVLVMVETGILLFLLAWLSYVYIEQPCLKLKKYFKLPEPRVAETAPVPKVKKTVVVAPVPMPVSEH